MSLSKTLIPFLYTFYLLGQSPFPLATSALKNNLNRFLFKFPACILIVGCLYLTIHFLKNDYHVAWDNRGLDIIHVLLMMSSLITNFVVAYQCLFQGTIWTQLQESFCRLDTEFRDLLPNKNVEFTKFRNFFLIKCSAMLGSYFVLIFAMVMSRITNKELYTSYMVVLTLINDLCAFQVVFYVDLTKFFLKTVTCSFYDITGDKAQCVNEVFVETKFILSMKKLHSSIYKTVDKINEYFGLFLLSYIVQQFLVISYYIFWIFLHKFNVGLWSGLG